MPFFPFYIARRYLISKKSHNVINIISLISVAGVAVITMSLIVVLSVFNGFDGLIKSLMNSFDPDLKITVVKGKTFSVNSPEFDKVKNLPEVYLTSLVLEEEALLVYKGKQLITTVKGVDDSYKQLVGIDSMIIEGGFFLKTPDNEQFYAVIGYGIAYYLGLKVNTSEPVPVEFYIPRRNATFDINPDNAINSLKILPSGIFAIQNEFDLKYAIVPIEFARQLLDNKEEITSLDIKLNPKMSEPKKDQVQKQISKILGDKYVVKNRFQQHALLYKVMKSEKWAIFFILTFILIVASFNIVGSLTMLIIDKKEDISTLQSLGAEQKTIHRIFFMEGGLISVAGAIIGLILGVIICFIQIKFGIINFPNSSIITAYPVEMQLSDFISTFLIVTLIGLLAAYYPVRFITRKYLN